MEINRTHQQAAAPITEKAEHSDLLAGDENAGRRIKDAADKVGVFGTIGAIVIGLVHCDKLGFTIGFLSASVLTLTTCAFVSLLYSYGDMIKITLEQGKILRNLEAEQNEEQPPPIDEQDAEPQPDSEETAAGQTDSASEEPESTAAEEELSAEEPVAAKARTMENTAKPELPLEAYEYDKAKRVAHFTRRTKSGVICPVCGKWQMPENDTCFRCSCEFYYDGESRDRNNRIA